GKEEMYARYHDGLFGNRLRSWTSLAEYLASDYRGLVGIRSTTAGGQCIYNVEPTNVAATVARVCTSGSVHISEMAPHTQHGTISGEVMRSEFGLVLKYSTVPKPMREALEEEMLLACGLRAKLLLQGYCDFESYEQIMRLLDELFLDHIVEFSCFSTYVGLIPRRNTLIWEVRRY
ncbi:MAG: hypothetical protein Q7S64_02745, partial [bacterium]|nr:hypothetical protein [bacterium]